MQKFTIGKDENKPSFHILINKRFIYIIIYVHTIMYHYICVYTMIYVQHILYLLCALCLLSLKREWNSNAWFCIDKLWKCYAKWNKPEEKEKYMIPLPCVSQNRQIIRKANKIEITSNYKEGMIRDCCLITLWYISKMKKKIMRETAMLKQKSSLKS